MLNAQLKQEQLTSKLYHNINTLTIIVLTLLATFTITIFRSRRKQHKLNLILYEQKEELMTVNNALQQSQDEVIAQRDDIFHKKELLNKQHNKLTQSVKSAQTIQAVILPDKERIKAAFKDYFILFKPRDVVSGDFYWFENIQGKRVIAAVDCTGHGIPGAFMSMIGFTLLNEIIKTQQMTNPAQILEKLRQNIRQELKQEATYRHDGMDMAILVLENIAPNQTEVNFAGAKRPVWYITPGSNHIQEIPGSRISIGLKLHNARCFTSQKFIAPSGTLLYTGSDGLADQNNAQMDKLGTKPLQQLLFANHLLPLAEQKKRLEEVLSKHMAGMEQRDDILWMGLQL